MGRVADPTLRFEREIAGLGRRRRASVASLALASASGSASADAEVPPHSGLIIGCDEVGRGALAGPVAVGLCVVDVRVTRRIPEGLRDSKMLAEPRREQLAPLARAWGLAHAVGYASASEIDEIGITACLGLAGRRAFDELARAGVAVADATVILDGHFDWLTPAFPGAPPVRTRIKADRDCASVAAASVISKVARDRMMIEHDSAHPHYGWVRNKGYASEEHRAAIVAHGASELHRRSWLHKILAEESTLDVLDVASVAELGGPAASALSDA